MVRFSQNGYGTQQHAEPAGFKVLVHRAAILPVLHPEELVGFHHIFKQLLSQAGRVALFRISQQFTGLNEFLAFVARHVNQYLESNHLRSPSMEKVFALDQIPGQFGVTYGG